jgi:imidazole glycerol-phosphate synthase subunit HisF
VRMPKLVTEASAAFGAQALIGSMDVVRRRSGRQQVVAERGRKQVSDDPVAWAQRLEDLGVGEILVTSVDLEGSRSGYDLGLIESVSHAVGVPLIAHGGAGGLTDLRAAVDAGASAVAAGQFFTFRGAREAVLITYPTEAELGRTFEGLHA